MTTDQLKTGTTTLAIVCADGVVVLADKRTSAGGSYIVRKSRKISVLNDRFVVTQSGTVSDSQLLLRHLRSELRLKKLQSGNGVTVREAAHLLGNYNYNHLRSTGGMSQFVLAGYDATDGYSVYDIQADGAILKAEDYACSGSGTYFATSVLDADYRTDITVKEGIELAKKALSSSIARDTASGDGYDIAVITKDGVELHDPVIFAKPM